MKILLKGNFTLIFAIIVNILITASFIILLLYGHVLFHLRSLRFITFLYLLILGLIVIILYVKNFNKNPYKRLLRSFIFLFWFLEILFSLGFFWIDKLTWVDLPYFFPSRDNYIQSYLKEKRSEVHPYLQISPLRGFYVNEKANYSESSYSVIVTHTDDGKRIVNNQISKNKAKKIIKAYGGSTTYGLILSDWDTWPSLLAKEYPEYYFENHGFFYYTILDNIVQQVINEVDDASCNIFFLGRNDIALYNMQSHTKFRRSYSALKLRDGIQKKLYFNGSFSPLFNVIYQSLAKIIIDFKVDNYRGKNITLTEQELFNFKKMMLKYLDHLFAVNNANNTEYTIVTNVYSQSMINDLENNQQLPDVPTLSKEDFLILYAEYKKLLSEHGAMNGYKVIHLDNDKFMKHDFIDFFHFSKQGAEKFAHNIKDQIPCLQEVE